MTAYDNMNQYESRFSHLKSRIVWMLANWFPNAVIPITTELSFITRSWVERLGQDDIGGLVTENASLVSELASAKLSGALSVVSRASFERSRHHMQGLIKCIILFKKLFIHSAALHLHSWTDYFRSKANYGPLTKKP